MTHIDFVENEYFINLDDDKKTKKKRKGNRTSLRAKLIIIILTSFIIISTIIFVGNQRGSHTFVKINENDILNTNKNSGSAILTDNIDKKLINIVNETIPTKKECNVKGFVFVDPNVIEGPITVDREKDDGSKLNLFNMVREEDYSFIYDYEKFNSLPNELPLQTQYVCEYSMYYAPEGYNGRDLVCPDHYTLFIDNAFYGRYSHDREHCSIDVYGYPVNEADLEQEHCGNNETKSVKELCEGKQYCTLKPSGFIYDDPCQGIYKYLHVNYHCVKDNEIKKQKISIVMFANAVKPNSVYENAISEFYQYAQIHGYNFEFYNRRFDNERDIYFMKLNCVIDKMFEAIKDQKYDWIFWADSDVTITNPNIKIESFLPKENMSRVHLIISDDPNGLNAGVFLIRVHPWSLNFLMRATSYSYFHGKHPLLYADQSSINNSLLEHNDESDHYIIVPQSWFNGYMGGYHEPGDFLLHLAGRKKKDIDAATYRNNTRNDESWRSKTNKEMRKEVIDYYNLPKSEQHKIEFEAFDYAVPD